MQGGAQLGSQGRNLCSRFWPGAAKNSAFSLSFESPLTLPPFQMHVWTHGRMHAYNTYVYVQEFYKSNLLPYLKRSMPGPYMDMHIGTVSRYGQTLKVFVTGKLYV